MSTESVGSVSLLVGTIFADEFRSYSSTKMTFSKMVVVNCPYHYGKTLAVQVLTSLQNCSSCDASS